MFADYLRPSDWAYNPGKTVIVIGPALGGPAKSPMQMRHTQSPYEVFGAGPLADALSHGLQLAPDVNWVGIRLNGVSARVQLPALLGEEGPTLIFETVSATASYNDHLIVLRDDGHGGLELVLPAAPQARVYRLSLYSHLGQLVEAINQEALAGIVPFWAATPSYDLPMPGLRPLLGSYPVTGGDSENELTRDDLFLRLTEVLDLIDGRLTDAVVLSGLYFDDQHDQGVYGSAEYGRAVYGGDADRLTLVDSARGDLPVSYHGYLADWCHRQAHLGRVVTGIVSCRPLADPRLLITIGQEYVRVMADHVTLRGRTSLLAADGEDVGRYLHVVCGEGMIGRDRTTLEIPLVIRYLRSADRSPTNTAISAQLTWELDGRQRDGLADLGLTTFYTDPRGQARIWSAVTAAPVESAFHPSWSIRQVQIVVSACLDMLSREMGSDFRSAYVSRRIDQAILDMLDGFKSAGVISNYSFSVEYIPVKTEVQLALSIQPRLGVESMQAMGRVTMR